MDEHPDRTCSIEITDQNFTVTEYKVTPYELAQWDIYAAAHPWLFRGIGYGRVLEMFLFNCRRCVNPNKKISTAVETT